MGANGVFKGMASFIGPDQSGWFSGRLLALGAAFMGGACAIGIFPEMIFFAWTPTLIESSVFTPVFALSICLSAVLVLWLGVALGFPLSTTTVLLGATFGAGIVASTVELSADLIFEPEFALFAAGPIIAWFGASALHFFAKKIPKFFSLRRQTFLAAYGRVVTVVPQGENPLTSLTLLRKREGHEFIPEEDLVRQEFYVGQFMGISVSSFLRMAHLGSALFLCFVWGLIELQKLMMVATLINFSAAAIYGGVALMGLMVGGLFFGKSVGVTLAKKISFLSAGSGFVASLTSSLIAGMSALGGVPTSLSHTIGGSIMGVGMAGERLKIEPTVYVLAAWIVTWPVAMAVGGICYLCLQDLIA